MSNHYGIDEAWQRLTAGQVKTAGKEFIVGYVSENTTGKNLTLAEVNSYHAASVGILLVYEYSITAVHGGASKGTADANFAVNKALSLGYPQGCAIAFAVDENTTGNPSIVDAYARAFSTVCHAHSFRSMVYGGLSTVKRCADLTLTDLFWQTYAWSGTPTVWDARTTIRQVQNGVTLAGKDVDLDTAMVDNYGAWMGGSRMSSGIAVPASGGRDLETCMSDLWNEEMQGHSGYVPTDASPRQHTLNHISSTVDTLATTIINLPSVQGGLSDVDRQAIKDLTAAVTALNSRLTTP